MMKRWPLEPKPVFSSNFDGLRALLCAESEMAGSNGDVARSLPKLDPNIFRSKRGLAATVDVKRRHERAFFSPSPLLLIFVLHIVLLLVGVGR